VRPPTIRSKRQRVSWSRLPARPTTIAVLDHREQGGDLVSQRATARRVVAGPVGRLALDQDGDPVRVATSDLIDRGVDVFVWSRRRGGHSCDSVSGRAVKPEFDSSGCV